jgi:hypothetical protein
MKPDSEHEFDPQEFSAILGEAMKGNNEPVVDFFWRNRTSPLWCDAALDYIQKMLQNNLDERSASLAMCMSMIITGDRSRPKPALVAFLEQRLHSLSDQYLRLKPDDPDQLEKWQLIQVAVHMCILMLSELGTPKARQILEELAKANPTNEFGSAAEARLKLFNNEHG